MDKILVLLHTEADGTLGRAARECLGVAASLGEYEIAISGAGAAAAGTAGAAYCVPGDEFTVPRSATDAAAAEVLIRTSGATLVLAPGTARWSRALPMAAARLNGVIDTHIVGLEAAGDSIQVKRWFYRQRIEGAVARTRRPWIVLTEPGAFPDRRRAQRAGSHQDRSRPRGGRSTNHGAGHGLRKRGRTDHPARRGAAVRRGRGLDQEAERRAGAHCRCGRPHTRLRA